MTQIYLSSLLLLAVATVNFRSVDSFQAFTRSTRKPFQLASLRDEFGSVLGASDFSTCAQMVAEAESAHGMPWKESIQQKNGESPPLLYMDFWEWQLQFMKENLTNLQVLPCSARDSTSFPTSTQDFSYNENVKKGARIVNLCFTSDEYSKIRMTYYDAGEGVQVFNSLWYPHESRNAPLLGIDLLSFNRKKYLGIVDFQPIHEKNEDHAVPNFESEILKPIRDKYPSLHGEMSAKFYDETQFFSKQMLFARFEDEAVVSKDLFPAFKEYVIAHSALTKSSEPDYSLVSKVKRRHAAYDTYSADRDPATGLFAAMFGKEWADEFVYGFLFSQSKVEVGEGGAVPKVPPAGPPQRAQKQTQERSMVMQPVR